MGVCAVTMWTVWIMAYLAGFSNTQWYPAYSHSGDLGAVADQQIATGILFFGAAAAFMPLIFWSLYAWLAPVEPGPGQSVSGTGVPAGPRQAREVRPLP